MQILDTLPGSRMDKSILVKLFGFPATLIHGDTLVMDRWLWLRSRLPRTRNNERLLDVGCGTGAFSIGAALRGYRVLGLSWDERNQSVASQRAVLCRASSALFEIFDVRRLSRRTDLVDSFDVVICLETIEHIVEDLKLMRSLANCVKPGGRLLLTTPYELYRPIDGDIGPFSVAEDGGHVRRGYSRAMLEELCDHVGLKVEAISYCSGYVSQKVTAGMRRLSTIHTLLGWAVILPLRILPPLLDPLIALLFRWPYYSVCLQAYRPRNFKEPES